MTAELETHKLEEGQTYKFYVSGTTTTPDKSNWYILVDPFGYKHLLLQDHYSDYNIIQGNLIHCRVDKINCDGKIFLEPDHPFYKPDKIYEFEFLRFINQLNEYGDKDLIAEVKDNWGNITHVLIKIGSISILNPPKSINCRLERIKKGRLFLSDPGISQLRAGIEIGKNYPFEIVNTFRSSDNEHYFLLLDTFKRKHLLPIKYYKNYNIEVGKKVMCKVIKFSSKGFYLLEPENPFYKIGNAYSFKIKRIENQDLVLQDAFNQEIRIECPQDLDKFRKTKSVKGVVIGFRKGRAVVDIPV